MEYNNKLIALIMVGGLSLRMGGGIKSLLEFNDKKIFDRILENIKPQINKIIINCNNENTILEKYNLPIIKDVKKGYIGPLAGIHAGMDWIIKNSPKTEWLLTLPGDTPFIPLDLVSSFEAKLNFRKKIILAKSFGKIHPIIGAWHISLFSSLNSGLDKGTRKILDWAETHPLDFINFKQKKYDPFFNINTKEDIEKASIIENNFF